MSDGILKIMYRSEFRPIHYFYCIVFNYIIVNILILKINIIKFLLFSYSFMSFLQF